MFDFFGLVEIEFWLNPIVSNLYNTRFTHFGWAEPPQKKYIHITVSLGWAVAQENWAKKMLMLPSVIYFYYIIIVLLALLFSSLLLLVLLYIVIIFIIYIVLYLYYYYFIIMIFYYFLNI